MWQMANHDLHQLPFSSNVFRIQFHKSRNLSCANVLWTMARGRSIVLLCNNNSFLSFFSALSLFPSYFFEWCIQETTKITKNKCAPRKIIFCIYFALFSIQLRCIQRRKETTTDALLFYSSLFLRVGTYDVEQYNFTNKKIKSIQLCRCAIKFKCNLFAGPTK